MIILLFAKCKHMVDFSIQSNVISPRVRSSRIALLNLTLTIRASKSLIRSCLQSSNNCAINGPKHVRCCGVSRIRKTLIILCNISFCSISMFKHSSGRNVLGYKRYVKDKSICSNTSESNCWNCCKRSAMRKYRGYNKSKLGQGSPLHMFWKTHSRLFAILAVQFCCFSYANKIWNKPVHSRITSQSPVMFPMHHTAWSWTSGSFHWATTSIIIAKALLSIICCTMFDSPLAILLISNMKSDWTLKGSAWCEASNSRIHSRSFGHTFIFTSVCNGAEGKEANFFIVITRSKGSLSSNGLLVMLYSVRNAMEHCTARSSHHLCVATKNHKRWCISLRDTSEAGGDASPSLLSWCGFHFTWCCIHQ